MKGTGRFRELVRRAVCRAFGHKPGEPRVEVADGCDLRTPDGREEKVSIRMVVVECLRCGRTLELHPAGIAECVPPGTLPVRKEDS